MMIIIMIANFFFQRAVNVDILPSRSKSKKKREHEQAEKKPYKSESEG